MDALPTGITFLVPACPLLLTNVSLLRLPYKDYTALRPVEDYVHLMLREIDMLGKHPGTLSCLSHHFGGGSPGIIRACDFEKIMERLGRNFDILKDAEIAIEIDPRAQLKDAPQHTRNAALIVLVSACKILTILL